eukprot:NODE_1259_length_1579_cov_30.289945_g1189_i0.p1 GENE.NODE_1259_length_1579_cov_30.289945_g1189_i0~~NODE_1259_length_1579_cov_30.289945_g1189_i0.p1  ORF type:complete len:506 (+),score=121.71 NODE_1259_length_1579_cov_30.289945_g1189_i0:52-1569(+)
MANFHDRYSLQERLGRGSYAVVHRCIHTETKKHHAVKIISKAKTSPSQLKDLQQEVDIMKEASHRNIINVLDVMDTPASLFLVLELVDGGDLFQVIMKLVSYTEGVAATLMYNLLQALDYLHTLGIVHRDLKPDNMLLLHKLPTSKLQPNDTPALLSSIKVADFGFATKCGPEDTLVKCCGTPYYLAPEILKVGVFKTGPPYGLQCDLWSSGVIAYVILCGWPPFQGKTRDQLFRTIVAGRFRFDKQTVWDTISDQAKDFVAKLLVVDPTQRLTAAQALQHPWLANIPTTAAHMPKVQNRLSDFNSRHKFKGAVFGIEAIHRLKYLESCRRKRLKPNSAILSNLEGAVQPSECLDLSNNYVGRKGLAAVMSLVESKQHLKVLLLNNNDIDNLSFGILATTLKQHRSITKLDCSHNPLTRGAGKRLILLLQQNPNIQEILLSGTDLHPEKLDAINTLLSATEAPPALPPSPPSPERKAIRTYPRRPPNTWPQHFDGIAFGCFFACL